jgi:hypothetical protein
MEEWQQRTVDEKTALDEKLAKLNKFIEDDPKFGDLPVIQADLMTDQAMIMNQYSDILGKRIAYFK